MSAKDSQIRATAYRHAQSFEDKKALRNRVADLVVELFDIPADPDADPAHPSLSDALLFKQGLNLFQPSDFDDLVTERNIDDRCGYGLCPKPNVKVHGGHTVWNGRGGKNFSLVPKAELEKWCSKECGDRALFVRSQLSKEPAWNRETSSENVRLLDEVQQAKLRSEQDAAASTALSEVLQNMNLDERSQALSKDDLADQLHQLALERGDVRVKATTDQISLKEHLAPLAPNAPVLQTDAGAIEGYRPRKIDMARDGGESSDEEMPDLADGTHEDPDA